MKIWVTGSEGMLGRAVVARLDSTEHQVAATRRDVNLIDASRVYQFRDSFRPDAIINCAGIRPGADAITMVNGNALVPHILAGLGVRLVHMSTDCVYSGRSKPRKDRPDPDTEYGRTKLAGESLAPHVLNVRSSFIGPKHGFLHWAMSATEGDLEGWVNAKWSGGSVDVVAEVLVRLCESDETGVLHVAAPSSRTKFQMLMQIKRLIDARWGVEPVHEPYIDRSMDPDVDLPPVEWSIEQEVRKWQTSHPSPS